MIVIFILALVALSWGAYRLALMTIQNRELIFVLCIGIVYWIAALEAAMGISGYLLHTINPLFLSAVCILLAFSIEFLYLRSGGRGQIIPSFLKYTEKKSILILLFVSCLISWALQHLYVAFRIYFTPPNVLDTLTYHLPTLIQWQHDGFFHLFSNNAVERIVYATKGLKLINFWHLAFFKNTELLELSQYAGYFLLIICAYTLLTLLKASREIRLAGVLAISTLPLMTIELFTLQDHMYLAAVHLTALTVMVMTAENVFEKKWQWVPLTVIAIVLLNAKFSAPAHIGVLGLVGLFIWRKSFSIQALRKNIVTLLLCGVLIGIFGGWSYVNNYTHFGSPFGPKLPQLAKQNKLANNLKEFPIRITDANHTFAPDLVQISGFGPIFFGIAVPILLIRWKRIRKSRELSLIMVTTIGTTLCYFTLYYTPYNYRLLQFIPITSIIVALACVEELRMYRVKQFVIISIAILSPLLVLTSYFSDYYRDPIRAYADSVFTMREERSMARFDSQSDQFDHDNSFLVLDQFVPYSESVAYISQEEPGYDDVVTAAYQDNRLRRRTVWFGDITDSDLFDQNNRPTQHLIDRMRRENIRYFHNNIVNYFTKSRILNFEGTPFIKIADELWYLPE